MRIIGGRWKRTPLGVVDAPGVRPTPDRVRETVFNWLAHAWGGDFGGRSALDLFAGSGALGLEAASRGAAPVVLVDHHPGAIAALVALRDRLDATMLEIERGDALRTADRLIAEGRRFDAVFLDPPYDDGLLPASLARAAQLCAAAGFVYVEAARPWLPAAVDPFTLYRADSAGEVFYHLLQRKI